MKKIRLRVGRLMDEKGLSIKDLAGQADIAQNTARGLYHGITSRIDLPILERVAQVLGVSPKELLEEYEEQALGNSQPTLLKAA